MQLTKGAIGNLINRYKAVLKKCHLMNTFGSLAVAGMLVMGGAGVAVAADPDLGTADKPNTTGYTWTGEETVTHTGDVYIKTGVDRAFQAYQDGPNTKDPSYKPTHTSEKGTISLGSDSSTIVIKSSIEKGSSYGVVVFDASSAAHSDQLKLDLTGDTISISAENKDGHAGALHVSSDVTAPDKDKNNTVNIVSKNGTIIYAKGTTEANAIELMSGGILNISGPLTAKAELDDKSKGNVIYARGGATLNIGANGETVKLDGNINFGYEGTTSGTGVDAFVNVTLTGADSYWNGNTITSWSPEKPSGGELEVTSLKVALNKGATWTPTVVENSESKDQQYTALNKLTLDGGIVDVNEGVAITIENIGGKGAITNAGSVTIEKGSIEGPITFEQGDATADNMVTVNKDGITTLTGGVAGSGTIDKLAIDKDGKTTITNAKLSGHKGRALKNEGTLTINGGSFEGNEANVAGAIYNADGATLTVDGVTFASNSSVNNVAGAINNRDGQVTIKKSTFTGNDSGTKAGGAIANTAGSTEEGKLGTITITGSTFEDNKAGNGGAVWNGSDGKVTIENSTFKDNTALAEGGLGQGGAITNADQMTITGGSFANNTAKYSGGAIYNGANAASGKASLTIDGTTFTGNSVKATYSKDSTDPKKDNIAGGAIFNDTNAKLNVTNATFTDNTSSLKGGAIFNRDGEVTIENSTFKGNSVPTSAGGAVLNESGDTSKPGTITIKGSTFEGNKAGNGGAVWNGSNGKVEIADSTFKGNTAVAEGGLGQGGAITNADQMTITGSTFEGNTAGKLGGAIFNAANGKLTFNGTNTFTNNTAAEGKDIYNEGTLTMTGDSHLIVDGNQNIYNANGAMLTVESGAKLTITDAVAGGNYEVVTGEGTLDIGTGAWSGDNLQASSDMVALSSNSDGTFTAEGRDAHTVFPNLSEGMTNAVNDLYAPHKGADGKPWNYADVNSDQMGVRFLSRATDNTYLGADKNAAAATIESAARIAFAGAVPQMTKMASDAGSNAVVNRLGFANPADGAQAMDAEGKIVDRNTTGFALWIAPLWQSQHGWGMEADNLDYGFNGNLGGVSLGADYTFENAIRAGITFNIGGGYAESSGGDLNSTENRMSFWGLGAYAGWNYENFGLMADVSYTSTWNDLQQDMDSRMGMGDLEADVQASAISAGLRAEYKLETSVLDVIPHIGVRYMSLNTWGFDAESNGGTVLEGDGFHQDIWTFPVGVTFTKDFTLDSGWSFKPSIDFSVIPAAGDIKAKQDVAFTGLPGTYEVETQMMDYLTWQGGVGLEMGNDTMSFGVNYTLQAGQHTTGHGVFGSFRYEF